MVSNWEHIRSYLTSILPSEGRSALVDIFQYLMYDSDEPSQVASTFGVLENRVSCVIFGVKLLECCTRGTEANVNRPMKIHTAAENDQVSKLRSQNFRNPEHVFGTKFVRTSGTPWLSILCILGR